MRISTSRLKAPWDMSFVTGHDFNRSRFYRPGVRERLKLEIADRWQMLRNSWEEYEFSIRGPNRNAGYTATLGFRRQKWA